MEFDGSVLNECIGGEKLPSKEKHRQRMTLHCQQCNTVLGDSLGVCGEVKCMDSIMCLKVTHDVVVSDEMESEKKGQIANCIYSVLKCRGCCSAVGKVIHSAPMHLDAVRSIFLLYKANISCFILNSSSMVEASTLVFDLKGLGDKINKVKRQFEVQLDQMSLIKSRLADRSVSSNISK